MDNDLQDASISPEQFHDITQWGSGEIMFKSSIRHEVISALEILPNDKFYRIDASCVNGNGTDQVFIEELPPDDNGYPLILYRLTFEGLIASIYKRGNDIPFNVVVFRSDRQTWVVVMIVNDKNGLEVLSKGLLPLFLG